MTEVSEKTEIDQIAEECWATNLALSLKQTGENTGLVKMAQIVSIKLAMHRYGDILFRKLISPEEKKP